MTRAASPAQIRARAALAFRCRQRAEQQVRVLPVRQPFPEETPLSRAEVAFGMSRGLIAAIQVMP